MTLMQGSEILCGGATKYVVSYLIWVRWVTFKKNSLSHHHLPGLCKWMFLYSDCSIMLYIYIVSYFFKCLSIHIFHYRRTKFYHRRLCFWLTDKMLTWSPFTIQMSSTFMITNWIFKMLYPWSRRLSMSSETHSLWCCVELCLLWSRKLIRNAICFCARSLCTITPCKTSWLQVFRNTS